MDRQEKRSINKNKINNHDNKKIAKLDIDRAEHIHKQPKKDKKHRKAAKITNKKELSNLTKKKKTISNIKRVFKRANSLYFFKILLWPLKFLINLCTVIFKKIIKSLILAKLVLRHLFPHLLLITIWLLITGIFTAIPGDLLYFPKVVLLKDRLSAIQQIDLLWPGYLKSQNTNNCVQSSLIQQELLKQITAQVAQDKEALLLSIDSWNVQNLNNCQTILPIQGLKSLAQIYISQNKADGRYSLTNFVKSINIHRRVIEQIDSARKIGFKSQRVLNEFSELALSLRDYKPNLANISFLDLYQTDLEIKSLKNMLETGKPIAVNYQELFLASCLLSPEYEVCQSPDKFNAKWNSVASAGSIKAQLALGRKLVSEILFYQGIFADNYKQIFFVASL